MEKVETLVKEMVEIQSVSGEEADIIDFLYNYCQEEELEPQKLDNNVFFSLGSGKKKLVFNSHIDTVEASGDWSYDPFGAEEEDGKIYGLGASDNKGSAAAMLKAAEELKQKEDQLEKEIIFTFVEKEEVDGTGTEKVVEHLKEKKNLEKAAAVVGEPTDLEFVLEGCKGTSWIELQVEAEGGHASKDLKNPIEIVYKIWNQFKDEIESFQHPKPKIELTNIEAGNSINKIPSKAEAKFDIRTVPGFLSEDVTETMEKIISEFESDIEFQFAADPCPPSDSQKSEIVEFVKEKSEVANSKFAKAANDSCFFTENDIKAAVIGPGQHETIHKPDEYIEKSKLKKSVKIYTKIAEEW